MCGAFGSRAGEDTGGGWRAAQGKRLPQGDCLACESWPSSPPRDLCELTPQTCSWSLRSRPSSWGQRVRPGQGAAACGVQRQGPGQAREFRERAAAAAATRGPPVRREGETAGVPRGGGWGGGSTTARSVRCRDDCPSLARSSPKPQLQPKTKTLPTCQQRRSSLGRAARASERRGRGGALRGGGGSASPPLPHRAQPRTVSRRAAGTWGGRARAHQDQERQGSAQVYVLWGGGGVRRGGHLWGGCDCARARRQTRRAKQGLNITGPPPPLRGFTGTHRPTRNLSLQPSVPSPNLVTSPAA